MFCRYRICLQVSHTPLFTRLRDVTNFTRKLPSELVRMFFLQKVFNMKRWRYNLIKIWAFILAALFWKALAEVTSFSWITSLISFMHLVFIKHALDQFCKRSLWFYSLFWWFCCNHTYSEGYSLLTVLWLPKAKGRQAVYLLWCKLMCVTIWFFRSLLGYMVACIDIHLNFINVLIFENHCMVCGVLIA